MAQLRAIKGNVLREEALWMEWANSSLPVPLSPTMRVVLSIFASFLLLSIVEGVFGCVALLGYLIAERILKSVYLCNVFEQYHIYVVVVFILIYLFL